VRAISSHARLVQIWSPSTIDVTTLDSPAGLRLGVWPNPSAASPTIEFRLAAAGRARVSLYDISGRRVRLLADGEFGGRANAIHWDGRDGFGNALPSGVYVVRLQAGDLEKTARVVLSR
jgi:flagellar hook assembly protein FlgD